MVAKGARVFGFTCLATVLVISFIHFNQEAERKVHTVQLLKLNIPVTATPLGPT